MSDQTIDPNYVWPLVLLTELSASDQAKLLKLVKSTLKDDLQSHSTDYFGNSFQVDELPHEVNVRPWSPPLRLLNSIARQGPCRDSQNNIHALAVLAYRSSRPRIIVADEATKRQLLGDHLPRVDLASPNDQGSVISVILVSTRRDIKSGGLSVFARRAICSAQEGMIHITEEDDFSSIPRDPVTDPVTDPDPQPSAFRSVHKAWEPLWAHAQGCRGLTMHDPYQKPFTSRTGDVLGREYHTRAAATALGHHLPPELVLQISNTRTPMKMPMWKRRPSENHILIFLMYPSTAQEREETLKSLQDSPYEIFADEQRERKSDKKLHEKYWDGGMSVSPEPDEPKPDSSSSASSESDWPQYTALDVTFELIPWEEHCMKTRLDLLDFWDVYCAWNAHLMTEPDSMPLICLHDPMMTWHYDMAFTVLTFKHDSYPSPVVMRKMSFLDIWESLTKYEGFNHCWAKQDFHFEGTEEEFWHPERPFYYNLPL